MLGTAGTLVGWIGSNLMALVPCRIILTYQRGVKFHGGDEASLLEPGLHWFWPFYDKIEIVDVRAQALNLLTLSITTTDGEPWSVSANIEYQVVDALARLTNVDDFELSLQNKAMAHIAQRARAYSGAELVANQRDLEKSLEGTLTTRAKKWGVAITDVGLTDCVRTPCYRLFGDPIATA
jgi:regulator of protease activity HflC (stomatin/prohibitin superfamily)